MFGTSLQFHVLCSAYCTLYLYMHTGMAQDWGCKLINSSGKKHFQTEPQFLSISKLSETTCKHSRETIRLMIFFAAFKKRPSTLPSKIMESGKPPHWRPTINTYPPHRFQPASPQSHIVELESKRNHPKHCNWWPNHLFS